MVGRQSSNFLSNCCHTCKSPNPAYSCEICQMVYYCSEQDRRENWQSHSHLCRAIYKLCKQRGVSRLYQLAEGGSAEKYRTLRHSTAVQCEHIIGRPLLSFELEILYWPKVCETCYKQSPDLLSCNQCEFAYACCDEHFRKNHNKWCPTMKLYQNITKLSTNPDIPQFQIPSDPTSMSQIIDSFMPSNGKDETGVKRALSSELLTYPLTVLQAVSKNASNAVVHVVGAELQAEVLPFSKWELYFLHLLPASIQISLVFIGPDLQPLDQCHHHICSQCREQGKEIKFEIISNTVYHDYLKLPNASRPDLITTLNAGLYRSLGFQGIDSWGPTLQTIFSNGEVPVLITEYTCHEIEQDLRVVKNRFPGIRIVSEPNLNPFASLKPNLNIISDHEIPVIFKNYYYMILLPVKNE